MIARLALLFLISALIVPNAAWSAHIGGHVALAADGMHSHAIGHDHHHDQDQSAQSDQADDSVEDDAGSQDLRHSHTLVLAGAVIPPDGFALPARVDVAEVRMVLDKANRGQSRPESLLRPPRTI